MARSRPASRAAASTAVGTYGPEENTAFETGLKKNFGDRGQNVFNASAFYYDYAGLQVNVLLSSAEGGVRSTRVRPTMLGLEAETLFELTENDHLNVSVNYLNAETGFELDSSYNVYCVPAAQGGCGDCATNSLQEH